MIRANKILGGILLIAGTSVGAGMLGLPVITAFAGFWPSTMLFIICWLIMLATAFLFLDVNLSISGETNFISMAEKTLGGTGKLFCWIFYLLLLYSLIAAYLAGSVSFFVQVIAHFTGYTPPEWMVSFALPVLFGGFIFLGTSGVDYINRLLMIGLIISFICLAAVIPTHFNYTLLEHYDPPALFIAVTVLFTSFGYHIIIPSLTTYMNRDRRKLQITLLFGSLIPLVIYLTWQLLVQASVPSSELISAWKDGEPATTPLSKLLQSPIITYSARLFSFFAIVTSFLGVSLSLSDFLIDGLKIKRSWKGRLSATFLTFVPPLIFVLLYEKGFYFALQHAGANVAIILGILPACMAWTLKEDQFQFYQSWKYRFILITILIFASCVVVIDLFSGHPIFKSIINEYIQSQ